jgi:hypothetical protein
VELPLNRIAIPSFLIENVDAMLRRLCPVIVSLS